MLRRLIAAARGRHAGSRAKPPSWNYDEDGLRTIHDASFTDEPAFQRAYRRGVDAAAGSDYHWRWRVYIGLWAADCARRLDGDFVECGVNRGFLSSAICADLDWDSLGKTFWLLDTFQGGDERQASEAERRAGWRDRNAEALKNGFYVSGSAAVRANFAQWRNVRIVEGSVPQTLAQVDAAKVAFLHLDMNCSAPEVAALEYFWERLVPGAFVLLDDYAYFGYEESKRGMDAFANRRNVRIVTLPTGQGLLVRPPRGAAPPRE